MKQENGSTQMLDTDTMSHSYVMIMIQSLKKKEQILESIIAENEQQKEMFSNPNLDADEFEKNMEARGKKIEELNFLDEGFQQTFDRMKEELNQNRDQYRSEIQQMQQLISTITEKGNTIRIQEQRNKQAAEKQFADIHSRINQTRVNSKQVEQYYQNMRKVNTIDSQYFDSRK